ncbi:MAG: hypothetical protein INR73_18470 [Williamsia sp.]|nr:hypothetical protein [Williamsia sp.]
MRRTQFITAAIVAAITFFGLHAFVGPRYYGPHGWYGWHGFNHWKGGYYDRPWYGAPYNYDPRWDRRNGPQVQPPDSTGGRY